MNGQIKSSEDAKFFDYINKNEIENIDLKNSENSTQNLNNFKYSKSGVSWSTEFTVKNKHKKKNKNKNKST